MKFNFGEEEFKFPPKDGFVAISKAPDSYIVKSQHTGTYCTGEGEGFREPQWEGLLLVSLICLLLWFNQPL